MKNLLIFLIALIFSNSVYSEITRRVKVDVDLSPAGSFTIETTKIKGRINISKGIISGKKIYVKVKDLTTGIDLRDTHFKKKLFQKKFPKIYVTDIKGTDGIGQGKIKIKNIVSKIVFKFEKLSPTFIKGKFKLSLKDFDIRGVSYMGVGVKDKINISVILPLSKDNE